MPSLDKLHSIWTQTGYERGVKTETDVSGISNFLVNYRLVNPKYGRQAFWSTVDMLCDGLQEIFSAPILDKRYAENLIKGYFTFRVYLPDYIRQEAHEKGLDKS